MLYEAVHTIISVQPTFTLYHLQSQLSLTRRWQCSCWLT